MLFLLKRGPNEIMGWKMVLKFQILNKYKVNKRTEKAVLSPGFKGTVTGNNPTLTLSVQNSFKLSIHIDALLYQLLPASTSSF